MDWLDALERRIPWIAMPGLIRHISVLMAVAFGLDMAQVVPLGTWLLQGHAVLDGQVWRAVTFLFVPTSQQPLFLLFELMILVMTGDGLESAWGSFRVTVYYLVGALGIVLASLVMPGMVFDATYLNLSLFFAFATLYPDFEILVFFILPVKVKWLAILSSLAIVWSVLFLPLGFKIAALLSVVNYLVFFGPAAVSAVRRGAVQRERQARMEAAYAPTTGARHTCTTCGRTEVSHPDLEFRYCTCRVCGPGGKAFCQDHLQPHKETGPRATERSPSANNGTASGSTGPTPSPAIGPVPEPTTPMKLPSGHGSPANTVAAPTAPPSEFPPPPAPPAAGSPPPPPARGPRAGCR